MLDLTLYGNLVIIRYIYTERKEREQEKERDGVREKERESEREGGIEGEREYSIGINKNKYFNQK